MGAKTEDDAEQQDSGNKPGFLGTMHGQFGHHQRFGRAQFGQRGWLRPAILRLLEEKPMNGMEMINKFYEASHGWWKPSPGSVYPLLETLEGEEVIRKRSDGRYEITKKFKTSLERPSGQVDEMITNMEGSVSYLEELSRSNKAEFRRYRERIAKLNSRLSKIK